MIDTYKKAYEIINRDPEIDPGVFWPSVGVTEAVAREVGSHAMRNFNALSRLAGIPGGGGATFGDIMAAMEIGATLAKEHFAPGAVTYVDGQGRSVVGSADQELDLAKIGYRRQ